jgi:Mitochondrial carrier protein
MSSKKDYESVLKFISGGVAGMIAKTIVAPIDRTKFLFMGTIRHFTIQSLLQELKRIKIEEGIKSYWKGNLAQLLRVFPYSGIVIVK